MILVFGKTGQVGIELSKLDKIHSLDRENINFLDKNSCEDAILKLKPDAVINAAAYTNVDAAEKESDIASIVNGYAPSLMARACEKLSIPLIHISSDYVFDGTGANAWKPCDSPNPINSYGKSKLQGENSIKLNTSRYAIIRTSWVFSPHGNNFLKTMLNLSNQNNELKVVNDEIGGPTPAKDIARACLNIANQLILYPEKSGTYHFCGEPEVSWYQFAKEIFRVTKQKTLVKPILSSDYKRPASRPKNSRMDCSLTKKIFNISQPAWKDSVEDIIKKLECIQ